MDGKLLIDIFHPFRPLPLHRVPPAAPARGLFRIDGSGDEYAGGVCRGFDLGGVEEGGGGEESLLNGHFELRNS